MDYVKTIEDRNEILPEDDLVEEIEIFVSNFVTDVKFAFKELDDILDSRINLEVRSR